MKEVNNKIADLVLNVGSDAKLTDLNRRLDQSLPVETESWHRVEQMLSYLVEFAPTYKVIELADAIGKFADQQAKAGYVLGQRDLLDELNRKIAC